MMASRAGVHAVALAAAAGPAQAFKWPRLFGRPQAVSHLEKHKVELSAPVQSNRRLIRRLSSEDGDEDDVVCPAPMAGCTTSGSEQKSNSPPREESTDAHRSNSTQVVLPAELQGRAALQRPK